MIFILGTILFSLSLIPVYAQESNILRLSPTDDTFVVVDLNDPNDIRGLQKNFHGHKDVLTTWYSWNVSDETKIFSMSYLKFDLNNISSEKIESAKLLLYANKTQSIQPDPNFAIYSLNDTSWSENDLSYDGGVSILDRISELIAINQPGLYEWDITSYVIDNTNSKIAIGAKFVRVLNATSEVVSFVSKESPSFNYRPMLVIKTLSDEDIQRNIAIAELEKEIAILKQPQTIEDENSTSADNVLDTANIPPTDDTSIGFNQTSPNDSGGCLIATATYGTELSPQVQLLRELRDNSLLKTKSGAFFMGAFNDVYYSFSPIIADYERENPVFEEMVKIAITPMISSLSILNYVNMDSDAEVLGYGISLILLNGFMYIGIPASVIVVIRRF